MNTVIYTYRQPNHTWREAVWRRVRFPRSALLYLGIAVVIYALIAAALLYFPFFLVYFFPKPIDYAHYQQSEFAVVIPSINAAAIVTEGVSPFDDQRLTDQIKKNPVHIRGTAKPGEMGTSYIMTQPRQGDPWHLARINVDFLKSFLLHQGDRFVIYRNGQELSYVISDVSLEWDRDINYESDLTKSQLIVETVPMPALSQVRLLITGDLIQDEKTNDN